ncbi:hypothetical protein OAE97_03905 [Verrucomicrobia bacterium]|nr:hypothetical protein [Verrucomicrobiota bacterium]
MKKRVIDSLESLIKDATETDNELSWLWSSILGHYYNGSIFYEPNKLGWINDMINFENLPNVFCYDMAKSWEWFGRAAFLGCPYSIAHFYQRYYDENDSNTALKYLRMGAQHNIPYFIGKLAEWYAKGDHIKRDLAEADHLWRRAAKFGDSAAQYELGRLHLSNRGPTEMNQKEARAWIFLASENNDPNAIQEYVSIKKGLDLHEIHSVENYAKTFLKKILIKERSNYDHLFNTDKNNKDSQA